MAEQKKIPPLRVNNEPDDHDDDRARFAWDAFQSQDPVYRARDREIEQAVRMLAGQQWWVYHYLLGWKDITYFMSDEEKKWRERPVFNRLLPWFILTHARMTENSFICTFLPGPDRKDADLAEILDILYKRIWRDAGMTDAWARCAAWMIVAGTGYLQSRVDLNRGEWERWIGKATLPLIGPDDQPVLKDDGTPVTVEVDGVPFDRNGQPLAVLRHDGLQITGEPHAERRGDIVVDVLSPLEVRGQWGPLPWHQQRIHMTRSYLTPEQVWETWGVELEPEITGPAASSAGLLERILFGSGFYGAASAHAAADTGTTSTNYKEGYICVQTTWIAPSRRIEGMEETPTSPGGRLLVTTRTKVLYDGPRPFAYRYTSPIRCFEFLRLPGRHSGSTPLEALIGPQRAYNKGWRQVLENRDLISNPQQVFDLDSGLDETKVDNQPGRIYGVRVRPGVKPIEWIAPPPMGPDVWRTQAALADELSYLGATHGTEPRQFARDASGELVRELRFNDDRYLGPTMRRAAEEMGRLVEDWLVMLPVVYTQPTILRYAGEDNVARSIVLMPEILRTASADVVPDLESMLPEGRAERRARIYKMWQDGAFGPPLSPEALRQLHELSRFPHMGRTAKPGGIHWTTAEQENGDLVQGLRPPTYEWYNHQIHLLVHEEFMSSPEWRRLPEPIKLNFLEHRQEHLIALAQRQQRALEEAQETAALTAPGRPGGARPSGRPEPLPPNPKGELPKPPGDMRLAQLPTMGGIAAEEL
jgi:hypothetical protein